MAPTSEPPPEDLERWIAGLDRIVELRDAGRPQEALNAAGALLAPLAGSEVPEAIEGVVARVLSVCARIYVYNGPRDAAITAYDGLIATFGDAASADVRDVVMRGRSGRAATLMDAGRDEEALSTYDTLVEELTVSAEPWRAVALAQVLYSRGTLLERQNRITSAIADFKAAATFAPGPQLTKQERRELTATVQRARQALSRHHPAS